jgi:hypothetical protein
MHEKIISDLSSVNGLARAHLYPQSNGTIGVKGKVVPVLN